MRLFHDKRESNGLPSSSMSVEPDDLIPFYGTEDRSLFAIERAAMDRQAKVIEYLRNHLPAGLILDIGAGDGVTAQQIQNNKII